MRNEIGRSTEYMGHKLGQLLKLMSMDYAGTQRWFMPVNRSPRGAQERDRIDGLKHVPSKDDSGSASFHGALNKSEYS